MDLTLMIYIILTHAGYLCWSEVFYIMNYNNFNERTININYYRDAEFPDVASMYPEFFRPPKPMVKTGLTTTTEAYQYPKPSLTEHEIEEACGICSRYSPGDRVLTELHNSVESIPFTEIPKLGGKLKRQTKSLDFLSFKVFRRELIKCNGFSIILDPAVHRIKREANEGDVKSDLVGIGLCKRSTSAPPPGRVCRHLISWDKTSNKSCVSFASCPAGYHLNGQACVLDTKYPLDQSVCSTYDYHISNNRVTPNPFIPPLTDPDICTNLTTTVSKPCKFSLQAQRMVSIVGFNQAEFIVTKDHHFLFKPDLKSIYNYNCSGCSNIMECSSCKGDNHYSENFPSRNERASCSCRLLETPRVGALDLIVDDSPWPIEYHLSELQWVGLKSDVEDIKLARSKCLECKITCEAGKLVFADFPDNMDIVKICSFSMCVTRLYSSEIEIPMAYLLLPTTIRVTAIKDSIVVSRANLTCLQPDVCSMVSCHLCWSKLLNPQCYGVVDGLTVFIAAISGLLFITLLLRALQVLFMVLMGLRVCFTILRKLVSVVFHLSLKCCGKSLRTTQRIYQRIERVAEDEVVIHMETSAEEHEIRTSKPSRVKATEWCLLTSEEKARYTKSSNKTTLCLLVIAVVGALLQVATACTTVSSVNFTSAECRPEHARIVCSTTEVFDMLVGTTGGDACLVVRGSDGVMGSIHISMKSVKTRCSEETLYWTYDSEPLVQTSCHCWGQRNCDQDTCKRDGISEGIATLEGLKLKTGPGLEACTQVKSEWLGKCVVPMDGCCFYAITFPPVKPKEVYRVSWCPSYYWELEVKVKSFLSKIPEEHQARLTVGVEKQVGQLSLTAIQVSSPPSPVEDSCFVESISKGTSYYAPCNKRGELVLGRVGEIQCASRSLSEEGSQNCTWVRSMVSIQTDFTQVKPSIRHLKLRHALHGLTIPLVTPDLDIRKDTFGYFVTRSTSETFTIRVKLPQMSTLLYSELSTCLIRPLTLTGCFNCLQGAVLSLHTVCESYPVLATITCPSLPVPVPMVITKTGNSSVKVVLSTKYIDETCNFVAGKAKGNFKIKANLIEVAHLTSGQGSEFNQTVSSPPSTGFSDTIRLVEKMFSNIGSFLATILPWWFGIAGVIVLVLLALRCAPLLLRRTVSYDLKNV